MVTFDLPNATVTEQEVLNGAVFPVRLFLTGLTSFVPAKEAVEHNAAKASITEIFFMFTN